MRPTPVVSGPTAGGNCELSVELAMPLRSEEGTRPDAEMVSTHAFQMYQGMDIGTAKPSLAERRGIARHIFEPGATAGPAG